jgi:hypothetical protein
MRVVFARRNNLNEKDRQKQLLVLFVGKSILADFRKVAVIICAKTFAGCDLRKDNFLL